MSIKIDLIIVGSQKAGTSTLLRLLEQHPEVRAHESGEFGYFIFDDEYNDGISAAQFKYYGADEEPGKITLAKNVGIFESEKALRRLKEHNPDVKIVVSLRNPVDRAYSAFWYMKSVGVEKSDSFKDVIYLRSKDRFPEDEFKIRSCDYLERGRYHNYLKQLNLFFGSDQIYVFDFDLLKSQHDKVCSDIFQFAGLADFPVVNSRLNRSTMTRYSWLAWFTGGGHQSTLKKRLGKLCSRKAKQRIKGWIKSVNKTNRSIPKMDPSIRVNLQREYRVDNKILEEEYGISFKEV